MLPGRDGFDVLAELRQSVHGRGMAVVMLSAMTQPVDIARGRQLGVDAYLTKPFEPQDLAELLAAPRPPVPPGLSDRLGLRRGRRGG